MRAVVCKTFGPPENLVVETVEDPSPGAGEVVVDVRAVAVTFPDTLIIQDLYQIKAEPPFIPGTEAAGVVSAVGAGVNDLFVGDDVVGWAYTGGFAERAIFRATDLKPMPQGLDYAEATGFGYAYGTSYYALKFRGDLKPGETLLILGASGSLGLATIELGKLLGARVIAAASTSEKLALCREHGADETINYDEEDLKSRAKELTGGMGVDVVFDSVGGDYAEAAFRATNWRGRHLVIGFTAGIPRIPLNLSLLKGSSIVGVFWGEARTREPELFQTMSVELEDYAAAGDLRPFVSRRCSLEEVPQALRDLINRKAQGKIVAEP